MKQLERLMYLQGGCCFFCGQPIPAGEASIEHLLAKANGGGNGDDNCVACCKTLNALLGSRALKEKLTIILNQQGQFKCPMMPLPSTSIAAKATPVDENTAAVIADLQKRGSARPRKLDTLRNTITSLKQFKFKEEDVVSILEQLQTNGYVTIQDGKVTYELPAKSR